MQTNENMETYRPLTGLVYLFNLIVGTGALTMPAAFANSGWLISLIIVIILCLISYITTTFVIESMSSANAILKQRKKSSKSEQSDDSEDEIIDSSFAINQRVELGAMAHLFLSKIGVKLFYITIAIYLFGDLSIYAAAIAKSLRDVTCDYEHQNCSQTLNLSDQCWVKFSTIDRRNAYRLYLGVILFCIGPFAFFNVQKTKYLQILTTVFRWIAFISMISLAIIALSNGKARGKPKSVEIRGVPNLFGVCVYSFMCHHSLPALVTPISNKKNIFKLIFTDYMLILVFYSLLSFTGIFTFESLQDIYTLNFQVERCSDSTGDQPVPQVPVLDYFLPLFPVFTLSTSFPIIAITLQNNLKTLFTPNEWSRNESLFKRKLFYPLIAIIPPFAVSFATEDLEVLVGIVGSYAGASIQYIFPALLVYYSRKKIVTMCPTLNTLDNEFLSPFGSKIWVPLVLIWSVICIIFVSVNHVLEFTQ